MQYQQATYLTSATKISQLPKDQGAEVAFMGRSNSGKSSALNTITGIKGLARTSSTPGRTQMINLFGLDDAHTLVDLPGYGYAKVPRPIKERWEAVTHEYLETRQSLCGVVLMMDVRHPLKDADQEIITWAASSGMPLHVLLTKSDKLKRSGQRQALQTVQAAMKSFAHVSVQLFSSLERSGVTEVRAVLDGWFETMDDDMEDDE
ncbi:MAG: YihA family ribosome biogenesis GTP-binding protein [Coxiellaceae bacterium]|nr:YihA family ribosome biogenesis GTP-binding protein [Coxiellaceae bacterium]|tara:strand:+ start:8635 stop:9249 length:615 start_codon:yes stop_codon:yes gene_type:complete